MRQGTELVLVIDNGSGATKPYAQDVELVQYEDREIPFRTIFSDGSPADAHGGAFIMTWRETIQDRTATPPLSKEATEVDYTDGGVGYFQVGAADAGALQITQQNGTYYVDIDWIDVLGLYGEPGERYQVFPPSPGVVGAAIGVPDTDVTPSPGQPPLGSGPAGMTLRVVTVALANVSALSGLQTINGVTLEAGDLILLTAQTDKVENVVWRATAGAWEHSASFPLGLSAAVFPVLVSRGAKFANSLWLCTTAAPSAVVGTNQLTWALVLTSVMPLRLLADQTERDALVLTSGNLGMLVVLQSNNAIYQLTAVTPSVVWTPFLSGGGSVTGLTSATTALSIANPTTTPELSIANASAGGGGVAGLQSGADKIKQDATSTDAARLAAQNQYSAAQGVTPVALTDAATIATNAALSNCFSVTIAGDRTLGLPSNLVAGRTYIWAIKQDAVGGRTLSYVSVFKWSLGVPPTLPTAPNALSLITGYFDGTVIAATAMLDVR